MVCRLYVSDCQKLIHNVDPHSWPLREYLEINSRTSCSSSMCAVRELNHPDWPKAKDAGESSFDFCSSVETRSRFMGWRINGDPTENHSLCRIIPHITSTWTIEICFCIIKVQFLVLFVLYLIPERLGVSSCAHVTVVNLKMTPWNETEFHEFIPTGCWCPWIPVAVSYRGFYNISAPPQEPWKLFGRRLCSTSTLCIYIFSLTANQGEH